MLPGLLRLAPAPKPRVAAPSSYRRALDTYRIYDGTDEHGIVGTAAPRPIRSGPVLADGLREPSRPSHALHGSGGVGRAAEVSKGGTKVWSCERHADELVGLGAFSRLRRSTKAALTLFGTTGLRASLISTGRAKRPDLV